MTNRIGHISPRFKVKYSPVAIPLTSSKDVLEHNLSACSDAFCTLDKIFGGSMTTIRYSASFLDVPSQPAPSYPGLNRRQLVMGIAMTIAGAAADSSLLAQTTQQPLPEKPGTTATSIRTSLHDEVTVKASAHRIYELLLDSKQFAALTGAPAEIDPRPGGAFSTFGKLIEGRNVELVPDQRIVQAWRPVSWEPGVYSIVKFQLKPHDSGAIIVLDHTGFPEGDFKHLQWGWNAHYWQPMKKTFS
jgi:uncharacterized protein YndB with AHSA1/START domain